METIINQLKKNLKKSKQRNKNLEITTKEQLIKNEKLIKDLYQLKI